MHRKQVATLFGATRDGLTVVPLDIHFNDRGVAKVLLGLGEGKNKHDKRAAIAARDWQRDKARLMRDKGAGVAGGACIHRPRRTYGAKEHRWPRTISWTAR